MMTLPSVPVLSLRIMRRVLVALALMPVPVISHAAEWDIDQRMRGLAQTRSDHVGFVEKKFIAMLDQPVESSGELFYTAPDYLEKRTLKPKVESMTVDGSTLVIERGILGLLFIKSGLISRLIKNCRKGSKPEKTGPVRALIFTS